MGCGRLLALQYAGYRLRIISAAMWLICLFAMLLTGASENCAGRPFPLFSRQCCIRLVAVSRRRAGNDGMVLSLRGRRGTTLCGDTSPVATLSRRESEFNDVSLPPAKASTICHNGKPKQSLRMATLPSSPIGYIPATMSCCRR